MQVDPCHISFLVPEGIFVQQAEQIGPVENPRDCAKQFKV